MSMLWTLSEVFSVMMKCIWIEFKSTYEESIVASRQPNSPFDVKEMGESRAQELSRRTAGFILRRTHAILDKYLPSKQESVVFCKPSDLQVDQLLFGL